MQEIDYLCTTGCAGASESGINAPMKISALRSPALSLAEPPAPPPAAERLPYLADHPDLTAIDGRIAKLRARIGEAEARRAHAKHRAAGTRPASAPIDLAERIADGATVPSADPLAEIEAANQEILLLERGIHALNEQRAEIVSRLNYETSMKFRPRHVAALRALDQALAEAYAAVADLTGIAEALHAGGYTCNVSALPSQVPAIVFRLGNPNDSRSETWRFREWLRQTFPPGAE